MARAIADSANHRYGRLMMIRSQCHECGFSQFELTIVMVVLAVLLGSIWKIMDSLHDRVRLTVAQQEIQTLIPVLRERASDVNFTQEKLSQAIISLPLHLFRQRGGKTVLLNPWGGPLSVFPGNAMAVGQDIINPEITISFEQIPASSCGGLVDLVSGPVLKSLGLIAITIAGDPSSMRQLCFAKDSYCSNIDPVSSDYINEACHQQRTVSIMFSYAAY